VTVKYTDAVLSFVSCTNDSYKTDGNSIIYTGKEATIKFSGQAEGKANIIVSSDVLSGSSAQVTVSGGQSAPAEEEKPAESTEPAETTTETTEETTVATGATVSGGAVGPITVATPDSLLTDHFVEASFVTEDGTAVSAYRLQNTESDFYYVYGADESGNSTWYCYDGTNHTLQRADTTLFTNLSTAPTTEVAGDETTTTGVNEDKASWKDRAIALYKYKKAILIVLFILLIALMVFFNIRMKKRDEEYDDDEDDFFEEYGEAQKRSDALEHIAKKRSEPEVKTVLAGKEGFSNPQEEDIPEDLSAALEATVRATKAEASREFVDNAASKSVPKQPVVQQPEVADDIDLSDAIIKQVTKTSNKQEDDDLKIIDFNDL